MTIKKLAIAIAMTLILSATSQAKPSKNNNEYGNYSNKITQFCADRVCGFVETVIKHKKNSNSYRQYRKVVKWTRTKKYKHRGNEYRDYSYKRSTVRTVKNVEGYNSYSSGGSLLNKAESYLGTNPTGWSRLWCARFIAVIAPDAAERLKRMGGNPNWARDYARLPGARHNGQPGDIVVLSRGRGGHIGVVKGFDGIGNPIVVSGNHGRRVGTGVYSRSRVLAYVPAS